MNKKLSKQASRSFKAAIYLVFLMLSIPLFSAFEFDNVKQYSKTGDYGTIKIVNSFGLGDTLVEYKLEKNTDSCLINCFAEGTIILNVDGQIYSSIEFKDRLGQEKNVEQKIYIEDSRLEDYGDTSCKDELEKGTLNNSYIKVCSSSIKQREVKYWKDYKGETLKAGTYRWRIEGKKKPLESIDWIITTGGENIGNYKLDEWAWWDTGWSKKKKVTLIEQSSKNLYRYTVGINVTYDSDMQSDFDDIRWIAGNETEELNYWKESGTSENSKSAVFWVFMPNITANDNTTIYMYYGNAGASASGTNISKAFLYGDSFDASDLDTVLWATSSGTWVQSGDGYLNCTSGNSVIVYKITAINYTGDGIAEFRAAGTDNNQFFRGITVRGFGTANYFLCGTGYAGTKIFCSTNFGSGLNSSGSSSDFSNGQQSRFRLMFNGTDRTTLNYTYLGGASTISLRLTDSVYRTGLFGLLSYDNVGYDWYGLRNFTDPEPKIAFGTEESVSFPPMMNLNYPQNYFNTTSSRVNITCSATDVTAVVNVTLYIDSSANLTILNTTANENLTLSSMIGFNDGLHNWTCVALDNEGNKGTNSTRYFTVDTIVPSFNFTFPNESIIWDEYIKTNSKSTRINWTISDANLGGCVLYNGTSNVSVTCSSNGSKINVRYINYTFIMWYNDTIGNYNKTSLNVSYRYRLLENSRTYTADAYQTAVESFSINLSYDTGLYSSIAAIFIYNGTSYIPTQTESNGNVKFNYTLSIPSVGTGNKSFFWNVSLTNSTGTYYIATDSSNQTINELVFTRCDGTYYNPIMVNYTIKDEETNSMVEALFKATFNYSVSSNFGKKYSISETNTSLSFCSNYNGTLNVKSIIEVYNENYTRRTFSSINNFTNVSITQKTLYLLSVHNGTNIIIELKNSDNLPLKNYYIEIQRYFPSTDSYITVDEQQTDLFGQIVSRLIENTVRYKFIFKNENGTTVQTSDKVTIACRATICVLPFVIEDTTNFFEDFKNDSSYDWSFKFDNSTNIFTYTWTDISGLSSRMRLYVEKWTVNGTTVICNTTSTSASGSLSCNVGSSNASYQAQAFRRVGNGVENRLGTLSVRVGNISKTFGKEGLIWCFFLFMTLMAFGIYKPTVGIALYILGVFVMSFIVPITFINGGILVAELVIGIAFIVSFKG